MRRWIADQLNRLAEWFYNSDHKEEILVRDEYGILRCHVEVAGDDHHGVDKAVVRLPDRWECAVVGRTNFDRIDIRESIG